tara:strand:- start:127 stop:759 length:633 start_codon:yes stop_codon:yes gene_type:complete
MNNKKKNNSTKKEWIKYGIFAIVVITLYATGLHTEVISFAQRGLLATGLMNPDVTQITRSRTSEGNDAVTSDSNPSKVDFNLKLTDQDGNARSLKEFKGKVIFLNYWATWCPPCVAEMPSINKLHEEMGDEITFVMLSFDQDFEKAKAFTTRKEYDLPIYAPAGNLPSMLQSSALPTTYVIDAEGNLAMTHMGMADYSDPEFKKFLKSLK